jgi:hypothetical protein
MLTMLGKTYNEQRDLSKDLVCRLKANTFTLHEGGIDHTMESKGDQRGLVLILLCFSMTC